jgi:ankyrin repeat protein
VPETSEWWATDGVIPVSPTPTSPAKEDTGNFPTAETSNFPTFENQSDANDWFVRSKGSMRGLIDSVATEPRYLDRQLPLQLVGTPLAYAVAVASQDAVEILLHLGAGSINGPRTDSRTSNPIHLATSLHLVSILDLLLAEAKGRMTTDDSWENRYQLIVTKEIEACLKSAWRPLAETSTMERTFIHGRNTERAITDVIVLLRGQVVSLHSKPMLTTNALITSSIEMGDISIASVGLPVPERCEDGTMESRISVGNRNLLMLMCTRAACSGCFDTPKCYALLEFALSRGSHLDCDLGEVFWEERQRAINIAIEFHRAEILDWFVQKGASLNVKDNKGFYPLHHLIRSGFSGTYPIKRLLGAGANPNAQAGLEAETGDTALQLAIKNNKLEEVSVLLQEGADPTLLCDGGDQPLLSALHCAVRTGNLEIVSLLLKKKPEEAMSPATESHNVSQKVELLSQKDGAGNTPLLVASLRGDLPIVNFLLEVGADVSAINYSGFNCMHIAASERHDTLLSIFAKKMDVNSKVVATGSTALHIASSALRQVPDPASHCCSVLLAAGADPTIEDKDGNTSLYIVASSFAGSDDGRDHQIRRSLLELMVEKGTNLDHRSAKWQTCIIHEAISNHDVIFIQDLLELGASVDILDKEGWTPLKRCATRMGRGTSFTKPTAMLANICKIADILISRGADVYAVDKNRNDLLVSAVLSGNAPMVHLLLEHFEKGINRVSAKPGNTLKPAVETPPPSISSMPSTKASKRESFAGKFKQIIKPKEAPISEESRLRGKEMAEDRLQNIGIIDREIILGAWKMAVLSARWNCVCAFIDRNLHGDTESLKFPVGLGLLKYALEADIGSVLKNFMGSHQHVVCDTLVQAHEPDPILLDIWTRVSKRTEKQRAKDIGKHTLQRATQLIEALGFTPLLDLPSLVEKEYVEGGYETYGESLKEAYITEADTTAEPPVFALFDEEVSENQEPNDFDEEIQIQLNSLFDSMRRKIGIFHPDEKTERAKFNAPRPF